VRYDFDYLVIGSGVAGLSFALKAASLGRVAIVTKRGRLETATSWAQGGIASVLSAADSYEAHIEDTLRAGAGLCHRDVVEVCVTEGPARVRELVERGARFTRSRSVDEGADLDLHREGGHSARRIVHADDMTGREVMRTLLAACEGDPNIQFFETHLAIDLLLASKVKGDGGGRDRCLGAYVDDARRREVHTFVAPVTVLATGGAGKVYRYTSNPDVATGDGVAMAYRAGASIANMEFFQFHPTCLYHREAKSFLISEALRGEGAILRLKSGESFMDRYHPMKSLAPRDIVARAIDAELKRTGDEHVLLDTTHWEPGFAKERFPNIYERCRSLGIDVETQPIPVVPAAHYACGGVQADLWGETDVTGLYAVGEVACTGLHGANRLASNSLLEALVFAHRAAQAAAEKRPELAAMPRGIREWESGDASDSDELVVVSQNWDEIRRLMWNYVGIVRTDRRLARAKRRLELLQDEIREYYWDFLVTPDLIELRNIATVASLIVDCAMNRRESRGLHYTIDYPETDDSSAPRDTVLRRPR
jgi:L-aspartate oxidase